MKNIYVLKGVCVAEMESRFIIFLPKLLLRSYKIYSEKKWGSGDSWHCERIQSIIISTSEFCQRCNNLFQSEIFPLFRKQLIKLFFHQEE